MNATSRLQRLFDYDTWATQRILDALKEYPELDKHREALHLLGHLLSAQQIWHRRTVGQSFDDLELWPDLSLDECETILTSMPEKWTDLLNKHRKNPDTLIAYTNTQGDSYETMLSDILHHLIIHGQHHRAQIATLIRESGHTPPATDFIYFTRAHK